MQLEESPLELPVNAVHVWYVSSDGIRPDVLHGYERLLTPDERVRRSRFVFAKDRHQFLVARGVLRTLLSRYACMRPEECVFVTNPYGKPSLEQGRPADARLEFSLSHTTGLVAVAITVGGAVGIDIEDLTRASVELDVRRFFSAAEAAALEALPVSAQTSRFFDYWTLKEAYVKARGMGLSLPLDSFSICLAADGPPTIEFGPAASDDPSAWQFAQFDPSPRHRMALAICRRGGDVAIRFTKHEPGDALTTPRDSGAERQ